MAAKVGAVRQAQRDDIEWFELIREVKRKAKRFEQATRRGDKPTADLIEAELQHLGEQVLYAMRRWVRHGGWTRYYQVRGGVVHTSLACKTLGLHTVLELMPELSTKPIAEVAAAHKMCRRCGHRKTIEMATQADLDWSLKRHYVFLT